MSTSLDHITVVSPTLEAGAKFVREALGVEPQQGGSHPSMGTHNLLLSLGASIFLEIISVDPAAPKPSRPRWFGLDELAPESPPRLAAWVVRTNDIQASRSCSASVFGGVEPITRGALSWLMTVPADGSLPLGGAAPVLIQWLVETHPTELLAHVGYSLVKLEVFHPEPLLVTSLLSAIGLDAPPRVNQSGSAQPYLVAQLQTPYGLRTLSAA
jgi:hypothetical protein